MALPISIPAQSIKDLCARYHVTQLALVGSVLTPDFREDSDLDFLISFEEEAHVDTFDLAELADGLRQILGRPVDLIEKKAIRNPYRKQTLLAKMEIIYEA